MLLYLSQEIALPSARLRLIEPAAFLGPGFRPQLRACVDDAGVRRVSTEPSAPGDTVVVQRNFPSPDTLGFVADAHRSGARVVYETDDAFHLLPEDHPKASHRAAAPYIDQALEWVDVVTVSSRGLTQAYAGSRPVCHVPSMLSPRLWTDAVTRPQRADRETVRLGLIGGDNHVIDFLEIAPVLRELMQRHPNLNIVEYGGGARRALEGLPADRLESVARDYDYPTHPGRLARLDLDLAAVPLRDDAFNACISDLKFLELGFLGVPAVFSNVGDYPGVVRESASGRLAATPAEWLEGLEELIVDRQAREAMGQRARAYVLGARMLSAGNNPLRKILNLERFR